MSSSALDKLAADWKAASHRWRRAVVVVCGDASDVRPLAELHSDLSKPPADGVLHFGERAALVEQGAAARDAGHTAEVRIDAVREAAAKLLNLGSRRRRGAAEGAAADGDAAMVAGGATIMPAAPAWASQAQKVEVAATLIQRTFASRLVRLRRVRLVVVLVVLVVRLPPLPRSGKDAVRVGQQRLRLVQIVRRGRCGRAPERDGQRVEATGADGGMLAGRAAGEGVPLAAAAALTAAGAIDGGRWRVGRRCPW